jgi:hypothetical protein
LEKEASLTPNLRLNSSILIQARKAQLLPES